jgi:hypothetical protein
MVTATTIFTKRLTLEPFTMADVQAIYEIAQEKKSIEDFRYVAHSLDDVKNWLEPSYNNPEEHQSQVKHLHKLSRMDIAAEFG